MLFGHENIQLNVNDRFMKRFILILFVLTHLCSASTPTCRSINYILDSLPRQCPTSHHLPNVTIVTTETDPSDSFSHLIPNVTSHPVTQSLNQSVVETGSTEVQTAGKESSLLNESTESSQLGSVASPLTGDEMDTPAGDEGFLSFEDWKRLNLLQSSGFAEDTGGHTRSQQVREAPQPRRQPGDQAIDSIGDEIEFQIDTSTYGKTSKERFNYASFDCAAAVLKSNPEAKGSSSILDENRDRYMLNKCGADNKFVIIEMCEDILVDTIVLANFEFFSSTFKSFRISVTDRYPTNERGWKILGTFMGNNTRTLQVFAVENPLIWARYLRLEFLSHYGTEFYCPLTLLRIHGTTMMEEYKNQENAKHEDYHQDAAILSSAQVENPNVSLECTGAQAIPSTAESIKSISSVTSQPVQPIYDIPNPKEEDDVVNSNTYDINPSFGASDTTSISAASNKENSSNFTSMPNVSSIEQGSTVNVSTTPEVLGEADQQQPQFAESNIETLSTAISGNDKAESSSSSVSPTTQESVYKIITKRLSLLEENATLSLRYIEEQSQLLRDVFSKMERRQSQKIDSFIAELNSTLVTRLQFFQRQQYEELWQSTIVELESQRDTSKDEIVAMSARLSLLADELIFQKRISIAHSVMLLVTLLFVLTTRGVTLDIHGTTRNGTARAELTSPISSPPMKRGSSACLHLSDTERTVDSNGEARKMKLNWRSLPSSRDSSQSAPASPPSLIRHWNSPPASSLNHDSTSSDDEEIQDSDIEYTDLPSSALRKDPLEEFSETSKTEEGDDVNYPTPLSNREMYE